MGDIVTMEFKELSADEFAKLTRDIDVQSEIGRANAALKGGSQMPIDVNSSEADLWSENMRLKSENEQLRALLTESLGLIPDGGSGAVNFYQRTIDALGQNASERKAESPDAD